MSSAARKYLRRVKRNLCCPRSIRRAFLRRLEDELALSCGQGEAAFDQLAEQFGLPEEVAANFLAELDVKVVSRCAYNRVRLAYLTLAAAVLAALVLAVVQYTAKAQPIANVREVDAHTHVNGEACESFWVKTQFRGQDVYWEYHSAYDGLLFLSDIPEDADGTEPYAVELYLNHKGELSHWKFGQLHRFWVKVHDTK